jgi:Sulfotransferase family
MIGTAPRLPDLIIGGAPRSGTTFICEILSKHPDAFVARPFIPEPKVCMTDDPAGDDGYRRRYAKFFTNAPPHALLVEKTSYYFENEAARSRLARLLPAAKFVFILREPAARAYSNWLWSRKNGLETMDFEKAIALEGTRPDPLPPERSYARPFSYMWRTRYGTFARSWIEAVGRERIGFYVLEDAVANPERFVASLLQFAGLRQMPWPQLATGRVNATEGPGEDFTPALAARLRMQIRPEIETLVESTGLDVRAWDSQPGC